MSTPGAGYKFPAKEVSWNKRDLLLFSTSIGCTVDELHFLYELHPNFAAFPTYPILLPFKHTDQDVIDFYERQKQSADAIPGLPKFDSKRVVDGQRKIIFHQPIPTSSAGRRFEVRNEVVGVYDKGKPGTVMETKQTIVDAYSGEAFTTVIGSAFFIGQGGWGGPKGEKNPDYPPPKDKKPDATSVVQTTQETAHLYRLNGDYNPLHADPEPGKKMGFGGTIIHGLYSWNMSAHEVLKAFGGSDPANFKSFEARFAAPVKPGDKLITEMWRSGNVEGGAEEIRFTVRVEGGKVVLSNGRALVKVTGVKSKI